MLVDPRKINLSEEDIEDWLFEYPNQINCRGASSITKWIGRQIHLPSGIADLVGINRADGLVVVEVKNVQADSAAIAQVCRYAADLEKIEFRLFDYDKTKPVWKFLICKPGVENKVQFEADAMQVSILPFEVSFGLSIGGSYYFSKDFQERNDSQIEELSNSHEFQEYKLSRETKEVIDEAKEIISGSVRE